MSAEVKKIRPARWIDQHSGIIQPYSLKRAQGAAILEVRNCFPDLKIFPCLTEIINL